MKIKTKLSIFAVLVFFALVAAFLIYKQSLSVKSVSIEYPENYTELNEKTAYDNEETVKSLGYSVSSFINHINSKNIISIAVNEDNTRQFVLTESDSVFSSETESLANVTYSQLDAIADVLMPNGYTGVFTTDNKVFLENKTDVSAKENYTATQLITVINGKTYTLNYYAVPPINEDTESTAEKVAKTLTVPGGNIFGKSFENSAIAAYVVLLGAVIVCGVAASVLLTVTLVRDFGKRRTDNENTQIQIKRRTKK